MRKKKWLKNTLAVLLGVSLAFLGSYYWDTRNDKLIQLRSDLTDHYYNQDQLQSLMEETLGKGYSGDLEKDFDHFVISLVMEKLSEKEDEKFQRYNDFMSKDRLETMSESRKQSVHQIQGEPLDDESYYIKLSSFVDGETYDRFSDLLDEAKPYKRILIDLRDNSGGHFNDYRKISELFLSEGKVIYRLTNSEGETIFKSKESKDDLHFDEIVLWVNQNTASVAELFVLSLKENLDHATVIGTPTYGKPFSYALREFRDGSGYIFITNQMAGPSGNPIPTDGISPDIIMEQDDPRLVLKSLAEAKQE
ncbi:S41 family peptidase [Marinicrinis lubricantis]|uniref:S41 family peptidase n=1 Tax=Marinicrinis lubricantis TaxID=2086470 RepID=A0ABW1IVP7_9BACL